MFRGYYAQQAAEQLSIESSDQDQVCTWPQRRFYRAYSQEDDDAVAAIQAKYGIHAKEEAVRLALRLAAGDAIQVKTNATAAKRVIIKLKKSAS